MSRIGRLPIKNIEGVTFTEDHGHIVITGPKGEQVLEFPRQLKLEKTDSEIILSRNSEDKKIRALHGLYRQLIANAMEGVSKGWEKKLDFKGVGYRAETQGDNKLVMALGFSHPVEIIAPEGITFTVQKNVITVSGIDKQKVGQVAANIRKIRPVEPYKGKGLKYIDEIPRKKLGKAAKAAGGAA
ncbi:TPA: 50S ribosomal protein L6 [Candidatus Berkelbacteria bacterium]|uniref:Large ribosomal subunit protein uL6 n=1 Tax=Berkelbacteria bacterium GW2011_GWE1_39_12 TaxID=1618337 RepID=A0A0G4B524_9BACT|nr:MAG: 50S ribosomal protein L6, large subunit ribosomal protein L6 [Berkelbacteria bacterium GW2011_GWE1_39_12]HBO60213.1 50S ribosomal protein L6 [Candidatus Berkelbacteria bacterium]